MIVCPNCNHQNPDGATQCEACYTPLPATTACPNCGASVQTDAAFCGQCGFNLKVSNPVAGGQSAPTPLPSAPELETPDPYLEPSMNPQPDPISNPTSPPNPDPTPVPATVVSQPPEEPAPLPSSPDPDPDIAPPPVVSEPEEEQAAVVSPPPAAPTPLSVASTPSASSTVAKTQLQVPSAQFLHLQTNTVMELPSNLSVIHVGKPNDQIPPDLDVSGFPNSDIVSRIHADIRVEGDAYYIEDVGSSNGTYVNHTPLSKGNRHRLRAGDRISLGKGDQVTFLFQNS
ncbi:MAG: FHA domain-containing protein [Coleofasciculaceae cyanobacterium]